MIPEFCIPNPFGSDFCTPEVRGGIEAGITAAGYVGLQSSFAATLSQARLDYARQSTLQVEELGIGRSRLTPISHVAIAPEFTSTGPAARADIALDLDTRFDLFAEACAGPCYDYSTRLFRLNTSPEILEVSNRGGAAVKVWGGALQNVPLDQEVSFAGDRLEGTIFSQKTAKSIGGQLEQTDDMLGFNVDMDAFARDIIKVPLGFDFNFGWGSVKGDIGDFDSGFEFASTGKQSFSVDDGFGYSLFFRDRTTNQAVEVPVEKQVRTWTLDPGRTSPYGTECSIYAGSLDSYSAKYFDFEEKPVFKYNLIDESCYDVSDGTMTEMLGAANWSYG